MKSIKIVTASKLEWLQERVKDLTSTEVSALFGLSPYSTYFEVWHHKKNQTYVTLEDNERMDWGNALEEAIAREAGRKNNWGEIIPRKDYYRIEELRLGSSFDFETTISNVPTLIEVKNVDGFIFKETWKKDEEGNIEAPYHIELQMQYQLLVSGYEQGIITALVGGNELVTLVRTPDLGMHEKIIETAKEFWSSIEENKVPVADYTKDADFIISMYQVAIERKEIAGTDYIAQMVWDYKQATANENTCKADKKTLKAKILEEIDDAEKVKGVFEGRNYTLTCKMNETKARGFHIYQAKEK